jgi:integrase
MSISQKYYLYKRKNGIYYIGYRVDGRRKWKSTGEENKSEALKALTHFEELLKGKTVCAALSKFIATFLPFGSATYSKCTVDFYEQSLNRLVSLVGDLPLSSLTMQHLDRYKVNRMKDKAKHMEHAVSAATINRELQALRAAMYTAVRWKLVSQNPFAKIQFVPIPEATPTYFSKEAFQTLLKSISEEWLRDMLIFGALTGMRRGEIVNLQWKDIDLDNKVIYVQSSPTFKTKNGKRRIIPMNNLVYSLLKAKAEKKELTEYVFTKEGKGILDDYASKKLKKYVRKQFGDDCKLHFHSLRHTFATWLVQGRVNIYEVQKLLGHSSVKVTEIYSHLAASELHSSVNKIQLPEVI